MALKAGRIDRLNEFAGSMADEMERAFAEQWRRLMDRDLPIAGQLHRRLLLSSIAQGVVKHLRDHPEAFALEVETEQLMADADAPLIRSRNPERVEITYDAGYGTFIEAEGMAVKQDDLPTNRAKSSWNGTVKSIDSDDLIF